MTTPLSEYASHPCFGMASRQTVGRLHLPVAPRANAMIRFGNGKAQSEPAMMPEEAVGWMEQTLGEGVEVGIVGISGPGDPMAVPEPTIRTLRMVRDKHPDISLCLTTIGLGADLYAPELAELGVSHVTLLVDAVTPAVAETLYAWIRPGRKTVPLGDSAKVLVEEQAKAVAAFKQAGITVKINTTVYPGYNADHVEDIASAMAGLGADIMAVVPYWPGEDEDEFPAKPDMELLAEVRDKAARHISLMPAWEECGEGLVGRKTPDAKEAATMALPKPTKDRPNVAAVSSNGMDVDLHLGHAVKILVYGPREDGLNCLLETREAPEPGSGSSRWETLAELLSDCFVLLTASAGQNPREILSRSGLNVMITDGEISSTVDVLYGGGRKGKKCKK
ncbi:radical SAM protein [Pseudodesulfovibrio cashew]|uniref:Radical SAM protein n=1 Tax=Pseudodesulfovibrio cashew TaxID=2678688 RepID=A0A6I6JC27_9BACT|nr:radical SAM protein [Pseudodesulfovibrio cashew]QGY40335.1 radical SAM protein [Pseudodesulfovibrio cashew]